MSNQYAGGFISKTPPTVTTSSAQGMWTLSQQAQYQKAGVWPSYSPTGQQAYTTTGTYSWVAPANVTKVSVVAVGGGSSGICNPTTCKQTGGAGGALAYTNNITVVPGNSYTVVVGKGGTYGSFTGGDSSFNSTSVKAGGGQVPYPVCYSNAGYAIGGTVIYGTGGAGGDSGHSGTTGFWPSVGSGGAGGYSGAGGNGGYNGDGFAGSGGAGGGGGASYCHRCAGGGGVGILGEGSSGAGGLYGSGAVAFRGGGGSGGVGGCRNQTGGAYGGGAYAGWAAGGGAVRIIWPGTTRSFPSTNTGNL